MGREVIELPGGRATVEDRGDHLFIVEEGCLRSLEELRSYLGRLEAVVARTSATKAIIDARAEVDDGPAEVRAAMWDWLLAADQRFEMVAFVLPSEMAMARVNMTALSRSANVRGFDSVFAAQRWLTRGRRRSTAATLPAMRAQPPAPRERTPSRPMPSVAGRYHITGQREERIQAGKITAPAELERESRSSEVRRTASRDEDDGQEVG